MGKMPFDIKQVVLKEGHSFNFFQAVYLLEKLLCQEHAIESGDFLERIRFITNNSMAFPASDIVRVEQRSKDQIITMYLSFMGLYGISSPLPSYEEFIHNHKCILENCNEHSEQAHWPRVEKWEGFRLPLCRKHHIELHTIGILSFLKKYSKPIDNYLMEVVCLYFADEKD